MSSALKVGVVAAAGLVLVGCGGSPQSAASRGAKAFQSAPSEAKAAWECAIAAMKTNGYAAALIALDKVQAEPGLTPAQGQAVKETATALSDQMYEAANKGDANAKAAIDELRKLRAR